MKVVVQRVSRGAVSIGSKKIAEIGHGLVVLLGISNDDSEKEARYLADKIVNLRIFEDEQGKMNRSLQEVGGQLLVVSQFTLYGDCRKGRRPSFTDSAPPKDAERLYDYFVKYLRETSLDVRTGTFQAYMQVDISNDGPVTLIIESN